MPKLDSEVRLAAIVGEEIYTSINLLQSLKAFAPMLTTLSGIFMLVSFLQPSKARSPMDSTPSGKVMLVIFEQSLKADLTIVVAFVITTSFKELGTVEPKKSTREISLRGVVILAKLSQLSKM